MKSRIIKLLISIAVFCNLGTAFGQHLNKKLMSYVTEVITEFDKIDINRRAKLTAIGTHIMNEKKRNGKVDILFVCTHNSRRSHMAHAWLETAVHFYGINDVTAYSGGLEATDFHTNAIGALERAGYGIKKLGKPDPVQKYQMANGVKKSIFYSKKYTDIPDLKPNFTAILLCADADKSCPIVDGTKARFAIPFEDPRYYDNTPSAEFQYDASVREIAREIFFLMESVKNQQIEELEVSKREKK